MKITESIAEIQLATGERINMLDLYIRPTYGKLLAGQPDAAFNERLLARLAQDAENFRQDKVPVLVLRPAPNVIAKQLPAFCFTALLDSTTTKKMVSDGSRLLAIWFNAYAPTNIVNHLPEVLKFSDWQTHAQDYQF